MKNILLIALLSIISIVNGQNYELLSYTPVIEKPKVELNIVKTSFGNNLNYSSGYDRTGPGLMLAGASFTTLGMLTSPEWYGLHGEDKKFFENPARAGAIIIGLGVLSVGIVITIGGN